MEYKRESNNPKERLLDGEESMLEELSRLKDDSSVEEYPKELVDRLLESIAARFARLEARQGDITRNSIQVITMRLLANPMFNPDTGLTQLKITIDQAYEDIRSRPYAKDDRRKELVGKLNELQIGLSQDISGYTGSYRPSS